MRFRTKLILWYAGLLIAVILVFGGAVYTLMDRTLVDAVDSSLVKTAELVTDSSRVRLFGEFGAPNQRTFVLPRLDLFRASGVEVQVWSVDGEQPVLEESSVNLREYTEPLDPTILGTNELVFTNVVIEDRAMRVLTSPMFLRGELLANVQAVALMDTVNEARKVLLLVMIGGSVLAVIASIVVGSLISRRTLRPIREITAAAESIVKTDDLNTRLPWDGPKDELGHLTSVFNDMMERLQNLFSVQQRFVADVSHELRTPLTAIRGNLDLLKRYGMDEMSMEAVESETDRMARMVNDLLLLARADYGGLTLDVEPLDLDTIVIEAHQQTQVLVKDRDLTVTLQRFEPVRISGNADRMKQLLLNLLSNAIKFTPNGGRIMLSLYAENQQAVLQVQDTGIGMSEDDLKHIFDRFYQADLSRVRGVQNAESSGLGLSIVKWIVEAHNGTITVESELEKGTTFTVRFPMAGTASVDADSDHNPVGRPRLHIPTIRRPSNRLFTPER